MTCVRESKICRYEIPCGVTGVGKHTGLKDWAKGNNVQIGIYEYSIFKQYGDNYEYNKIIYSTTMKKIIEI